MLKDKIIRLLFSYSVLWFLLVKILGIDLVALIPPAVQELGKGLAIVIFLFAAFRLYDYFAATAEKRSRIHAGMLRWFLPGKRYDGRGHGRDDSPSLLVRESRWMMLVDALEAIFGLTLLALGYHYVGQFDFALLAEVRLGLLAIGGLIILSSLVTLLQAIIADELLHVTDEGIALPLRYNEVIPWGDITSIELRRIKKQGYGLYVHFNNPARSYAWRGLMGGIRGHHAHKKGRADMDVSLEHANVRPGLVQRTINHYLSRYGRSVILNGWEDDPRGRRDDFYS